MGLLSFDTTAAAVAAGNAEGFFAENRYVDQVD